MKSPNLKTCEVIGNVFKTNNLVLMETRSSMTLSKKLSARTSHSSQMALGYQGLGTSQLARSSSVWCHGRADTGRILEFYFMFNSIGTDISLFPWWSNRDFGLWTSPKNKFIYQHCLVWASFSPQCVRSWVQSKFFTRFLLLFFWGSSRLWHNQMSLN